MARKKYNCVNGQILTRITSIKKKNNKGELAKRGEINFIQINYLL